MPNTNHDSVYSILELLLNEPIADGITYKDYAAAGLTIFDLAVGGLVTRMPVTSVNGFLACWGVSASLVFLNVVILKLAAELDKRAEASHPHRAESQEFARRERLNSIFTYFGVPRREATTTSVANTVLINPSITFNQLIRRF